MLSKRGLFGLLPGVLADQKSSAAPARQRRVSQAELNDAIETHAEWLAGGSAGRRGDRRLLRFHRLRCDPGHRDPGPHHGSRRRIHRALQHARTKPASLSVCSTRLVSASVLHRLFSKYRIARESSRSPHAPSFPCRCAHR